MTTPATPELDRLQKNKIIWEFLGWKCVWRTIDGKRVKRWRRIEGRTEHCAIDYPPLCTESIDAIVEAVSILNRNAELGHAYDQALCDEVKAYEDGPGLCNHMRLYQATAEQRTNAFIKVLQKFDLIKTIPDPVFASL